MSRLSTIVVAGAVLFAFLLGKASNHQRVLNSAPYRWLKSVLEPPPAEQFSDKNWLKVSGLRWQAAASGFRGPVDIAFVPNPGDSPDSPLYLVTELRGDIKAVLRNGEVTTVATVPQAYKSNAILPAAEACYGLHALCFGDEKTLYTTAVVEEKDEVINRIIKWRSTGSTPFSSLEVVREQREVFRGAPVGLGHSIGNCQIGRDGFLYVGVGNGQKPFHSSDPSSVLGKILRFDRDLEPADPYILSSGYRNPWAFAQLPDDTWLVVDNGPAIDRLVQVGRGRVFPWDGTDGSIAVDTKFTWNPPIGPADAIFVTETNPLNLPMSLLVSGSGIGGIVQVFIDKSGQLVRPPRPLIRRPTPRYDLEAMTGIAMGPDGLYAAHMIYDASDFFRESNIYRLSGDGTSSRVETSVRLSGSELFAAHGCYGCHFIDAQGSHQAPPLDDLVARVKTKLHDPGQKSQWIEASKDQYPEYSRIIGSTDLDAAVKAWIQIKLLNPRLWDQKSSMPQLELSEQDRQGLVEFLTQP